jgi:hypothetical protein
MGLELRERPGPRVSGTPGEHGPRGAGAASLRALGEAAQSIAVVGAFLSLGAIGAWLGG